mgnify:CR=1 FL=1
MTTPPPHGLKRLMNASRYSAQGIKQAFNGEAAFREEIYAAAILLPLACWVDVSTVERILLIAAVMLVLIVELLNSALEAVVDRIGTERHPLSGQAKDMGSAAVLLSLLLAVVTWWQILG